MGRCRGRDALRSRLALVLGVLAACAAAIDLAEYSDDAQQEALQAYQDAQVAAQRGDWAWAERCYRRLVELMPNLVEAHTNLGVTLEHQGKFREAIDAYLGGLQAKPNDAKCYENVCQISALLLQGQQLSQAQLDIDQITEYARWCMKAVELAPDSVRARGTFAGVLTLLVRFDDAAEQYREVIKRDPKNDELHANFANCLSRAGHTKEAIVHVKKAVKLTKEKHPGHLALLSTVTNVAQRYVAETIQYDRKANELTAKSLTLKDESCKSGKWKVQFGWDSAGRGVSVEILNPDTAYQRYGREAHFAGQAIDPYFTFFKERAIQLVRMEPVWVAGWTGTMHRDCTLFTGGHSHNSRLIRDVTEPLHPRFGLGTPERVSAPVISVMQLNLGNYYHWMWLPRLLIGRESVVGRGLEDETKVKYFLPCGDKHIEQSLAIVGIPDKAKICYDRSKRYRFDRLYYVDWRQPDEDDGALTMDAWSTYYPPKAAIEKVREVFAPSIAQDLRSKAAAQGAMTDEMVSIHSPVLPSNWQVVYLTRRDTFIRNITSEDALLDALRDAVGTHRLTVLQGKYASVQQQASTMARAAVVVGAHGAGMTNVIFCKPNTTVVMFPMNPHVDNTFGHLFAALDMDQWIVAEVGAYYYKSYPPMTDEQIDMVVTLVLRALRDKGLLPATGAPSPPARTEL